MLCSIKDETAIVMKRILVELTCFVAGIIVACWSLFDIGNNEALFFRRVSPTFAFGISLIVIFLAGRHLLLVSAKKLIPPTSFFHLKMTTILGLKKGQEPYLESVGYFVFGVLVAVSGAPYMNQLDELKGALWLSLFFFAGIACIVWGLLLAFLTALRLPEKE